MKWVEYGRWTRGKFVRTALLAPAAYLLAACTGRGGGDTQARAAAAPAGGTLSASSAPANADTRIAPSAASTSGGLPVGQVLQATPQCGDDDDPTPAQTEGPYFTPNSPERTSLLEPGMPGTRLVVSGYVFSTACETIPGALIDFWQCDAAGVYDNVGYRLRGHQFTDADGRYELETIIPGIYPGRTRHIHVKVQAPNQPILTTQLYFPGEPQNARDGIFRPECLMDVQNGEDGKLGTFNFVLQLV